MRIDSEEPAGERRPESIRTSCWRRSAAFRGEGRAPPRRSRIRRERAKGFLPLNCKRNASPGAGVAEKADTAGAFDSKAGVAPAQVLINEKTNETAAMPTPLSNIGSGAEGPAATADAPDAQKEAAKCIKEAKADYLLAIKANAGEIFGDIAVFFDMGAAIEIGAGRVEVLSKGMRSPGWVSKRGSNIEIRDYFMAECPKRLFNASSWEGMKSIAVEAETKVDKFGKTAYAAGFYISSLDDMREAARAARLHWGVENGPRWHLDAAFGADKSKETGKGAPTQLQALKSIASNALRFGTGFFKKGKYTINTLIEELSIGTAQIAKFLRFFSLGGRRREAA